IGRRARLRIWCRKACRFESCPWQNFCSGGRRPPLQWKSLWPKLAVAFVEIIDGRKARNLERLLPPAIGKVARRSQGVASNWKILIFSPLSHYLVQRSSIENAG